MAYVHESPKVYSYIRFSSEQQAQGDSLRRQLAKAREWADKHGMEVDTHTYRDLGVSAYNKIKNNITVGKFGEFLEAVEIGKIRPGSILLVESLDRISRQQVNVSQEIFLRIINRGIKIVTLADNMEYSVDSIAESGGIQLVLSILVQIRASEESTLKTERVKDAWADKFTNAHIKIVTRKLPAWLEVVDNKITQIDSKVKVIRRIFELCKKGEGSLSISRIIQSEGWPTMSTARMWTDGLVSQILSNKAVCGYFQAYCADREDIVGYYPAIIDESLFNEIQLIRRSRKIGGVKQRLVNLFPGKLYCAHCGGKMRNAGGKSNKRSFSDYIRCKVAYAHTNNGICSAGKVNYTYLEKDLIREIVVNSGNYQFIQDDNKASLIKLKIDIENQKLNLQKIADVLEKLGGNDDLFLKRYMNTKKLIAELTANLETAESKQVDHLAVKNKLLNIINEMSGLSEKETGLFVKDMRKQFIDQMAMIIDRIDIDPEEMKATICYSSGKTIEMPYSKPGNIMAEKE